MTESHPPDGAIVHDGVVGWTVDGISADADLLGAATELLDLELPDQRFIDDQYLRWCYLDNPLGSAVQRHQQIPGPAGPVLVAHYVNVPRRYRGPDGELTDGAWSFVIGVTNAKSTGAFAEHMGWKLLMPLPVKIIPALGRRRGRNRISHKWITDEWLDSGEFTDLAAAADRNPVTGWSTDYTPEVLRWRLACPHTRYAVHISDDMALITTRSSMGPIPTCVVLKVFPLVSGRSSVDATRAIRSATLWHKVAFAVYAGFNGSVRVRGITPPIRLRPSPLNLMLRALDSDLDPDTIRLDTFEFLDMDAY